MKNLSVRSYVRISVCIGFFLSFAGCSREPEKAKVPPSSGRNEAATTVLSDIVNDLKPGRADHVEHSSAPAVQNLYQIAFNDQGWGVAYIAETEGKFRVVHNGKAERPYQVIRTMILSPDGRRVAYAAFSDDKWRMVIDDVEGAIIDEVGLPVFSPDSRHIAYEVKTGEKWQLVVDGKKSGPCPPHYVYHDKFFSSDSVKLIFIENPIENNRGPLRVVVSDLALKGLSVKQIQGNDFFYNKDKTRIALICEHNGKKRVVEFGLNQPDAVKEGPLYDAIIRHTFGADGVSVVYVAERGGKRYLVLQGKEVLIPKSDEIESLVDRPDKGGAGLILGSRDGYYLYQVLSNRRTKEKQYDGAANLIYNSDGSRYAYVAKKGENSVFVVVNGKEGPAFDMAVTPVFSPDGKFLIYRARKDGNRFVVVADMDGKMLRQHAAYEQVFQPVFTADGKSIAYGVKDGSKLIWKVEKLQ